MTPPGVSGHVLPVVILQTIQRALFSIGEKVLRPMLELCLHQGFKDVEVVLGSQSWHTDPLSGGGRCKPLPAFTEPHCHCGSQKTLSGKGLHGLRGLKDGWNWKSVSGASYWSRFGRSMREGKTCESKENFECIHSSRVLPITVILC